MKKIIFLIAIIICLIQFVTAESKIPVKLIKIVDGDNDFLNHIIIRKFFVLFVDNILNRNIFKIIIYNFT